MRPPYELTPGILRLIALISEQIGAVKAVFVDKPSVHLRKENRIKTIHGSLRIEGNTLTEEQITALLENKRVLGPKKDILEVMNAIRAYEKLRTYKAASKASFLSAHKDLMEGLIEKPGQFRTQAVGIMQGSNIAHLAPPAANVDYLMSELFDYVKRADELTLVKSCVFHYEMEFIHPFLDGNGRMGRLWQTVILMTQYPVFEYIPLESLISKNQQAYYKALAVSDKSGNSTAFITFMLEIIHQSLNDLLRQADRPMSGEERLDYFLSLGKHTFSRKDYLDVFTDLSTATASRDLNKGVQAGLLVKTGDKRNTVYTKI